MTFRITNLHRVLSAVASTPWALQPEKLEAIVEALAFRTSETPLTADEVAARIGSRRDAGPVARMQGNVAVIPLFGTIMPRANMMTEMSGGTSVAQWIQQVREAVHNPDVSAVVLDVDSPGGAVSGIPEAADALHALRGQKPIVAVANTLMASAAYWLGSQADSIVASTSADVGSVGVYTVHRDFSRAMQNEGITHTVVKAGRFKAEAMPFEPLSAEARAEMQARVDEAYAQFTAAVARGRGVQASVVRSGYGEGRVLSAARALEAGMIDRIATLDDVVAELSGGKAPRRAARRAEDYRPELAADAVGAGFAALAAEFADVPFAPALTLVPPTEEMVSEPGAGPTDTETTSSIQTAPQAEETTVTATATPAPTGAAPTDDRVTRLADLAEMRPEASHRLSAWIREGTTYEQARAEVAAGISAPEPTRVTGVRDRAADQPWESFGHFTQAVYHAGRPGAQERDPRLFAAATGINQTSPSEGGFAVPGQFANSMWDGLFSDPTSLLSQTDNYDVEGAFIEFPRIEEVTRATGTVYGGVQAYWIAEAGQITGSKPKFGTMRLEPQELAALVYVTEKHLNNSPYAMGQYVDRMGRAAISLKSNAALIGGDGVGKPKGLTTAGCKVPVSKESSQAADTINARNIGKMKARRVASVASQYVWLANTDIQPELDNLSTIVQNVANTENVGGYASPIYNPDTNRLGGLPVIWNDHCEALGDEGDLILTHLPSYAVGLRRAGVKTAQSMHLRFDYAEMAFRFMFDIDGQSWLHTALTPPKGSTKSTVITLQAR